MDDSSSKSAKIINLIETKSKLKQLVFKRAVDAFEDIKEILHEMSGEINDTLTNSRLTKVEYRDKGKFEAQLQVADDILIFSMHTNVFQFERTHPIFENEYIKSNPENSYCGVINVYNFLADSFKYNRQSDEGYLIGRIFINHENHIFAEGKHQNDYNFNNFSKHIADRKSIIEILENSIEYAIEFDLLVPPYDVVKTIAVEKMNSKIENSRVQTGKRLGYTFNLDDI